MLSQYVARTLTVLDSQLLHVCTYEYVCGMHQTVGQAGCQSVSEAVGPANLFVSIAATKVWPVMSKQIWWHMHKALTATYTLTLSHIHTHIHIGRQMEQNVALVSTWSQSCFVFEAPLKSTLLSIWLTKPHSQSLCLSLSFIHSPSLSCSLSVAHTNYLQLISALLLSIFMGICFCFLRF